jgi:hypothetical protein
MADRRFVPARELSGAFYDEVVRPLLDGHAHAAALLGWGSDVLGYDTARSTDHGWGPRLLVFVAAPEVVGELQSGLDRALPERFRGWPVRYGWDAVTVRPWVTVTTLAAWLDDFLGVDASAGLSDLDWLITPQQRLLGVVAGPVYADDGGALERVRRSLTWYPDAIWRWLLACQWHRLAQEEAFVARAAEVGDDSGSAVTAARLARDVMRLALLLDRRYAPYQKWLGTAFARGRHEDRLPEHLRAALRAPDRTGREAGLAVAYEALAHRHNRARLTPPLDASARDYHDRPARVLMADRFTSALLDTVGDATLRALPLIGGVDQMVDSTDVLQAPRHYRRLSALYPDVSRTPHR